MSDVLDNQLTAGKAYFGVAAAFDCGGHAVIVLAASEYVLAEAKAAFAKAQGHEPSPLIVSLVRSATIFSSDLFLFKSTTLPKQ